MIGLHFLGGPGCSSCSVSLSQKSSNINLFHNTSSDSGLSRVVSELVGQDSPKLYSSVVGHHSDDVPNLNSSSPLSGNQSLPLTPGALSGPSAPTPMVFVEGPDSEEVEELSPEECRHLRKLLAPALVKSIGIGRLPGEGKKSTSKKANVNFVMVRLFTVFVMDCFVSVNVKLKCGFHPFL